MNKLELKKQSHIKYESLTKSEKSRMVEYARSKLPAILQNCDWAIKFQIFQYIRNKLTK